MDPDGPGVSTSFRPWNASAYPSGAAHSMPRRRISPSKVDFRVPGLVRLTGKSRHQHLELPAPDPPAQGHEYVGLPEVAVVLGDLVLEDRMGPEGVPGQLPHQAVVLVEIVSEMREDQVGIQALHLLEHVLHRRSLVRQVAVPEGVEPHVPGACAAQQPRRAPLRLGRPRGVAGQDHPVDVDLGIPVEQGQQRAGAPDLDVVGVGAQQQDGERPIAPFPEAQRQHDSAVSAARSPLMKLSSVHM